MLPQFERAPTFDPRPAERGLVSDRDRSVQENSDRRHARDRAGEPRVLQPRALLRARDARRRVRVCFPDLRRLLGLHSTSRARERPPLRRSSCPRTSIALTSRVNLQDFWRRWHISLSSWLRDYLYIPLGGSRGSSLATYRNLFLTMLLGGLWHGASWNFVLWGALHGGRARGGRGCGSAGRWSQRGGSSPVSRGLPRRRDLPLRLLLLGSSSRAPTFDHATLLALSRGSRPAPLGTANLGARSLGILALAVALHLFPRRAIEGGRRWFVERSPLVQGVVLAAVAYVLLTSRRRRSPSPSCTGRFDATGATAQDARQLASPLRRETDLTPP